MYTGTYVPWYLCTLITMLPVPMFPGTYVYPDTYAPCTYVPWNLCTLIPMLPVRMFLGTSVP